MNSDLTSRNASAYRRFDVLWDYRRSSGLQAPERAILERFAPELRNKRVLDIGVGGGRTTPHLTALTKHYVGIDLSPEMVSRCGKSFPNIRFEICDVRDLSRFASEAFDTVLFSFNGLDMLTNQASRVRALGEIRRVLLPSGLFIFSSHNRACEQRAPWDVRALNLDIRRPLGVAKKLAMFPVGIVNHMRMKAHETSEPEYALVNDNAHGYSLLTYYISIEHQLAQLERSGFTAIEAVGLDGRWLTDKERSDSPPRDPWIYYVCRRSG